MEQKEANPFTKILSEVLKCAKTLAKSNFIEQKTQTNKH